ncbi:MAG: hypothetical protein AVDCRST_MAG90-1974 [uncultured Microvirga sp.]|uniref:Uncharacterized protein n=1 Tax=uncultured Microvirga sp. TaxID=412392 RepID=A0A6J4LTM8_9HYPH|nr:MAG: hypothetical protein AVDCRST_MAG90-1974 [uncultured Microvirga sp.]
MAIDALINRLLVAPLGPSGAVMVLSILSVVFAALAYRRRAGEQQAATLRP